MRLGERDEVHQEELEDLVEVRRGERAQGALWAWGQAHLLVSFWSRDIARREEEVERGISPSMVSMCLSLSACAISCSLA